MSILYDRHPMQSFGEKIKIKKKKNYVIFFSQKLAAINLGCFFRSRSRGKNKIKILLRNHDVHNNDCTYDGDDDNSSNNSNNNNTSAVAAGEKRQFIESQLLFSYQKGALQKWSDKWSNTCKMH